LASILDPLWAPNDQQVLFHGRVGALRLADGRSLVVEGAASRIDDSPAEPPDNSVAAPDRSLPVRRPAYLNAVPLFAPHVPDAEAGSWDDIAPELWASRLEPDSFVRQDPYTGGLLRVCQALRWAAVADLDPLAVSFSLSYGDGGSPEAQYQLTRCVQGAADALAMAGLAAVSGEIECAEAGADPNLRIWLHGAAGSVSSAGEIGSRREAQGARSWFADSGSAIVHLGRATSDLSGSLYLERRGVQETLPPPIDLIAEGRVLEVVREARGLGLLQSLRPVGRGGLLITLALCCAQLGLGAETAVPEAWSSIDPAAVLFGEAQSRFLVSVAPDDVPRLQQIAGAIGVPALTLGTTGGADLTVGSLIHIAGRVLKEWPI